MVNFQSTDGIPLQGILYKPENFDPSKKYPMIVYLYEKLSQNLNHFVDPRPMDSINISYYVSNGYLVFTPDIAYTVGYPGQSALKCVLPGIQAVVDRVERQLPGRDRHRPLRVLDVREALVFGGGENHPVAQQGRGAVVIDGIDSECVHDGSL